MVQILHSALTFHLYSTDDLKKDELIAIVQTTLRDNKPDLSGKPALQEYYDRMSAVEATPRRARASSSAAPAVASDSDGAKATRSVRKRASKVKEEVDSEYVFLKLFYAPTRLLSVPLTNLLSIHSYGESPVNAIVARTPAVQRAAARVPLPPSPAVVADAIERQTAIVKQNVERYWTQVGVDNLVENARENLSSVVAVQFIALLIEAVGIRRETLHMRFAFNTPAVPSINIRSHPVYLPDFFEVLTSGFWAPTLLWTATSFALPALLAYFINLTLKKGSHGIKPSSKSYRADPLIYSVTKALITWLVYAQGVRFGGFVSDETVATVDKGLFGGYQSVLIGSSIGILVSLYEAALRK